MRLRLLVGSLGLVSLGSCRLPPKLDLFSLNSNTTSTLLKNYEIGRVQTATVGEPIVRVQQAAEASIYVAQRDFRSYWLKISKGTRYSATDSTAHGSLKLVNCSIVGGPSDLLITPDGVSIWIWNGGKTVELKTGSEPLFKRVTVPGYQPGAFTAELMYSGLAGKVVRAVYREYVNDMARPAFSQELQYDLNADRTLAFRSLRLRVDDASNSTIRYAVTSDGDLSWLPRPAVPSPCGGVAP